MSPMKLGSFPRSGAPLYLSKDIEPVSEPSDSVCASASFVDRYARVVYVSADILGWFEFLFSAMRVQCVRVETPCRGVLRCS
jgi:hypothetical protein